MSTLLLQQVTKTRQLLCSDPTVEEETVTEKMKRMMRALKLIVNTVISVLIFLKMNHSKTKLTTAKMNIIMRKKRIKTQE